MLRFPPPVFDISNCRDEELPIRATPKSKEPCVEIEGVGGGVAVKLLEFALAPLSVIALLVGLNV